MEIIEAQELIVKYDVALFSMYKPKAREKKLRDLDQFFIDKGLKQVKGLSLEELAKRIGAISNE